ncbi:MAG: PRC-barrel domain containing protein [Atopobiaceae bacterium]
MLRVSQLKKMSVFVPKKKAQDVPESLERKELSKLGKIHQTVFAPDGKRVVGFMVRRPDVVGMVKRADVFLALDAFVVGDLGLVISRPDGTDDRARTRLGLAWDKCLIWEGMDAKTTDGRDLGWVGDAAFNAKTGAVSLFFVGDGNISESLVGNIEIPTDMLVGYKDGYMMVAPAAAHLALDGGLAAKAGEGYARAKIAGKEVGEKIGAAAGTAVEKGAFELGRLIGKAQRAVAEATADDEEPPAASPVEVTAQVSDADPDVLGVLDGKAPEPRTFVPVSELEDDISDGAVADGTTSGKKDAAAGKTAAGKTAAKKAPKKQNAAKIAREFGKQLGKTRGMFGSFMDEYKKSSK